MRFIYCILSLLLIQQLSILGNRNNDLSNGEVIGYEPAPIYVKFQPWSLDKDKALSVPCSPSAACNIRYFYGYEIERTAIMLVDNNRKILLEVVPKSDCSGATVMFAQNMGFRYGVEYDGWPHHFRKKYLYPRCGKATPCMMYDPAWFRFKIVRNPFSRVVSGFIHIMRNSVLTKQYIPMKLRKTITFNQFLEHLSTLNDTELQRFGQGHCSFQSQPYERRLASNHAFTIYHAIVHAENPRPQLDAINAKLGSHFYLHNIIRKGPRRNAGQQNYVGSLPWWELKDHVPKDYGLFYSKYSIQLVEKIGRAHV